MNRKAGVMKHEARREPRRGEETPSPKVFTNRRTRTITYIGEINWEGVGEFIQQWDELAGGAGRSAKDPICFQLCTDGGDVEPGMAMYSIIKRSKARTTGVVIGTCQSMGTVILMAANTRLMHPEATLMHHTGTTSNTASLSPEEHEASAVFDLQRFRSIDRLVFNRTKGRFCHNWDAFVKATTRSVWMTAHQAVKMGFADDIK